MKCSKCGQTNSEDNRYCENCGTPLEAPPVKKAAVPRQPETQAGPGMTRGEDGILRWVYEMDMWKNPTLLITIWKVLMLASFVPALLVFFLSLEDGLGGALLSLFKVVAITAAIVSALMLLAYPLVSLINGGKYCVLFEMDEHAVKHIQIQKQFKKSQVLSMLAALSGLAAGSPAAAGAGLLAASKQSSISRFDQVKTIMVDEKRQVIYVNEKVSQNQVYAEAQNFAFVRDFILSRCPKARVTHR